MARDYKDSPQRTTRGIGHPIVTGIIIGLLLGLVIAVAVVLFINRSTSPYKVGTDSADKAKPFEKKAADAIKPLKSDQSTGGTDAKPAEKPRFDFYEILPGDKDAAKTAKENAAKPIEKPVAPVLTPTPAKPAEAVPTLKESVFLQAGAYQSVSDADNQKAKLALLGFEANVASAQVAGKGTLYRVRIGPYKSMAEATKAAGALSQSGVATSVIKGETQTN
jgi:cell division protein FtsN